MSADALSLRPAAHPNGFGSILMDRGPMVRIMTEPSEILQEEHEVIQHLLHVLTAMAERVDRGEAVARADVDDVLEIVVKFADECHHAKEEKALFPALRLASPQEGAALVHRLEGDHEAGRHLVAAMRSESPAAESGDPKARSQFAKDARSYAALLTRHIDAETEQLFPLVERALPAKERAALADEFDRIEREETGAGVHEKYEGTIHRLADRYVHAAAHAR